MKRLLALFFILVFALAVLIGFLPVNLVWAQEDSGFAISMPVEYVNYTIVSVNGGLWAKIDGTYPMHISGDLPEALPMVYPTPPQTVNISITLDGKQLPVSNYTEMYPSALHHTAIGDWAMVAAVINPVSETFTLGIHYEHPLQMVNGSYLLLYDLNISPYLSPSSNNSTAYFTFRMQTNVTNTGAFTTETDTKWNPINYTITKDGTAEIVSVVMHSEYNKPLLGDLVVTFSSADSVPEYSALALMAVLVVLPAALIIVKNKSRRLKLDS